MWIIAGLGNPGRRYEKTRHNVGFEVVDELVRRHMQSGLRTKFGGEAATGLVGTTKVLLLKPMEFMNKSGFAVQRATQFHDTDPEHLLVIHDELDLPPARLRLKSGGGHGGNNGLRSIIEQLGSRDFLRIRVGIGKPAAGFEGAGADHVLSPFDSREIPEMQDAINRAADAAEAIVALGMTVAMNDFNGVNPN
ncbi:MAG: aminoacyl-tRNA hydrolase [Myxococcales bacterium]|nr:aminoacyl-tRNA hydrolase [Myxococcales bacterium]